MKRKALSETMLTCIIIICLMTFAFGIQISIAKAEGLSFLEQQIIGIVDGSRAYNYDLKLEEIALKHYAFRSGGSPSAEEAAYWIKEQFESFGLEAWFEPFEFTTWNLLSKPLLVIDEDGDPSTTYDQVFIKSFQSTHLSWPTREDEVFADLVVLPLPEAANRGEIGSHPINEAEWSAIDTTGNIVLIGREVRWSGSWGQTFKSKLAAQPPAAVIYTWWYEWMSFTPPVLSSAGGRPISGLGPYYWDLETPVGFVNYKEGLWIRNKESTTNISALVSIKSVIGSGTHFNVIGRIMGYENPEKVVIISSHYDTAMSGGFCDNGAGTSGVLEIAKVLSEAVREGLYRPRYTLLFVPFTSEELGLVGSINYVKLHKTEMPNILAVINLDCIGSDELRVTETNPVGEFDLDEIILDAALDLGLTAVLEPPGGADQEVFRRPSWANDIYYRWWQLDADISDAIPVESSALLASYPLLYRDMWTMGRPGWIHTSYDNSTSTETLNWVEVDDLENHIEVAALTVLRISPSAIPVISATIDIDPDSLNLVSNGKWITAYIELSEDYNIEDINVSTIMLNDTFYVGPDVPIQIGDYNSNGITDLMVKFERASVTAQLKTSDYSEDTGKSYQVTFKISGKLKETFFEGYDAVRILTKG